MDVLDGCGGNPLEPPGTLPAPGIIRLLDSNAMSRTPRRKQFSRPPGTRDRRRCFDACAGGAKHRWNQGTDERNELNGSLVRLPGSARIHVFGKLLSFSQGTAS